MQGMEESHRGEDRVGEIPGVNPKRKQEDQLLEEKNSCKTMGKDTTVFNKKGNKEEKEYGGCKGEKQSLGQETRELKKKCMKSTGRTKNKKNLENPSKTKEMTRCRCSS